VSDHRDSPDPRTDITDLYVFQAPGRVSYWLTWTLRPIGHETPVEWSGQ
jgi:hypothetical protein